MLHSDNCSTQYKSQFIFNSLKKITHNFNINIAWFYGIAGHGRGIVDAMSSFGCKSILRNVIINNDTMFDNAFEICEFLKKCNDDSNKFYEMVDPDVTAKKRRNKKVGHPLKGC